MVIKRLYDPSKCLQVVLIYDQFAILGNVLRAVEELQKNLNLFIMGDLYLLCYLLMLLQLLLVCLNETSHCQLGLGLQ